MEITGISSGLTSRFTGVFYIWKNSYYEAEDSFRDFVYSAFGSEYFEPVYDKIQGKFMYIVDENRLMRRFKHKVKFVIEREGSRYRVGISED